MEGEPDMIDALIDGWIDREVDRAFNLDVIDRELDAETARVLAEAEALAERNERVARSVRPQKRRARYHAGHEDALPANPKRMHYRRLLLSPDWMIFINPSLLNDRGSLLYDEFRRRFRIPVEMFHEILARARAASGPGMWPDELKPRPGPPPVPLGMKILGVFRMWALGVPYDGLGASGAVISAAGSARPALGDSRAISSAARAGDADGRGARSPFGELSSGIRVAIVFEGRGSVREGARAARRADEWTARRAESDSSISQVPAQSTIDRLSGRLLSA